MKRKVFLWACAVIMAGCRAASPDVGADRRVLSIECEDYEDETKSSLYSEDESAAISDINVFVYDSSGNLVNGSGDYESFFLNSKNIDMARLFPDYGESYSVYTLANFGRIDPAAVPTSSDADDFCFTFDSFREVMESGFPKAAVVEGFRPDRSPLRIKVKRLLTRYHIKIINDSDYAFELKSLNVRQSARNLYPFRAESAADLTFEDEGDSFTTVEVGNDEGTVYVLENARGEVFGSYSLPMDRTRDNLSDSEKTLCTYLEFCGKLTDVEGGLYENAVFRYYFGKEKYVGVKRNQNVEIRLSLSSACATGDGWRKDPGEHKYISPLYNTLTFSWRGTDTFVCPLYSESFSGVQELSPTGEDSFTMNIDASLGWKVTSFPSWMRAVKQGTAIECFADYLPFGQSTRTGVIVLTSIDGTVTRRINVSQNPPTSWMRFPSKSYSFFNYKDKPTADMTINLYYDSSVSTGGFTVQNVFAVTGIRPGIEDLMMSSLTNDISISYGTVFSSGDSRLKYRHPVTVKIPKATVSSLRDKAGANGCILYLDFDNSLDRLYAAPAIQENAVLTPTLETVGINSGLPRCVIRLY